VVGQEHISYLQW